MPDLVAGRAGDRRPAEQSSRRVGRNRRVGPAHVEAERRQPRAGAVGGPRAHARARQARYGAPVIHGSGGGQHGRRLQRRVRPDARALVERGAVGKVELVALGAGTGSQANDGVRAKVCDDGSSVRRRNACIDPAGRTTPAGAGRGSGDDESRRGPRVAGLLTSAPARARSRSPSPTSTRMRVSAIDLRRALALAGKTCRGGACPSRSSVMTLATASPPARPGRLEPAVRAPRGRSRRSSRRCATGSRAAPLSAAEHTEAVALARAPCSSPAEHVVLEVGAGQGGGEIAELLRKLWVRRRAGRPGSCRSGSSGGGPWATSRMQ